MNRVGVRGGHPVRKALVDFELPILEELDREQRGIRDHAVTALRREQQLGVFTIP